MNDKEKLYKLKQKTTERKAEKEESDLISDLL